MDLATALQMLAEAGTAQNRKVYARHGVGEAMYGVSFANLGKLKKSIGVDQGLAQALWESGNHDARVLATMVADPSDLDRRTIDAWARDLDNYVVTDAFSGLVAQSPHARACMEAWTDSKQEWIGTAGWNLLARLASTDSSLPDSQLVAYLKTIEANIHKAKNRVRYAMNMALIVIGTRNAELQTKAVEAAKRIGTVRVDHGETGCKTPDAVSYIAKTAAYRKKKARRARAPAQTKAQSKKGAAAKKVEKTAAKPVRKGAKKAPARKTTKRPSSRRVKKA